MFEVTLEHVLGHIHNWFERESYALGECQIQGGALPESMASKLHEGQWYRIQGSYLNDGLHQHPATDLADETFSGQIDLLAIPRPLLAVVESIQTYIDDTAIADQKTRQSPYTSESFGGYSYTMKGSTTAGGGLTGWQAEFASQLNQWRKIS